MIFHKIMRLPRKIFKLFASHSTIEHTLCPFCSSPGYLAPLKSIVMQLHSADKLIEFNDDDAALLQDIENRTPSWTCPQWTCTIWEWTMMMRMWIVCGHSVHPKEVSLQGVLCINFWNWKINKARKLERIKGGALGASNWLLFSLSLSGKKVALAQGYRRHLMPLRSTLCLVRFIFFGFYFHVFYI